MARRAALALVRTPPRPALPLTLRPGRRALAVLLAAVGLTGLAYLGARSTSVFAFGAVELAGAPPNVAADVREALRPLRGESLVALDPGDVEDLLAGVPTVRSAHVDRAFPHTLAVTIVPERPLAVVRDGREAWVVAESGRVLEAIGPADRLRLPRLRADLERAPSVGATLAGAGAADVLAVLAVVPKGFPGRVLYARADADGLALVLREGPEVRLGDRTQLTRKLAAAVAVLRSLK